jgi:3D (Asp-Asp-Asp) domain-containing protein
MNRTPEQGTPISRRRFVQLTAAAGTAVALNLSKETTPVTVAAPAEAFCAPAANVVDDEPKTAIFNMVGQRVRELATANGIVRQVEGYATGVDLRISLAQDPRVALVGTFKQDREIIVPDWATLYGMGPLDEKGYPVKGRKLDVYTPEFKYIGKWGLDTTALVDRCGTPEEEGAWLFNVERAVARGNGQVDHTLEFQFGVVPNCGPKRQRYISVIRESGIIVPTPAPTPEAPVIVPTPTEQTVRPSQTPVREMGEPTESPAQTPLRTVGQPN